MRALGALGAVAALLAAYLLFFDQDPRESRSAIEGTRVVAPFDPAAVRRVTIARSGEPPFVLVHVEHGWKIEPRDESADQGAIEDLLGAAGRAETTRGADLSPSAAGLTPPRVTLTIDDGQRSLELRLGIPDASGRGVFVQGGAAAPVRVGPRRLLELADRPAAALRDRRLFPLAPETVASVVWRTGPAEREHRWDRTGQDRWRNAAGARIGSDRVASVLRRLTELRGAPAGTDGGRTADDGAWIDLRSEAGVPARVTGPELPRAAREDVWHALESADAPDLRLLSIPPERVRRLDLEDGARQVHLARDGAAQPWRFDVLDARFEVDQEWVAEFLARLASTTITAPATEGRRLIVDGRTEDAVTVGRSDPAFALLDPDPLRFRSRKILDFAHFDVRELQRTGGGVSFDLRSVDGETWSRVKAGAPLDGATVSRIAGTLGNLRAERFVDSSPAGPASFVLHVQIQPPGSHAPVWHRVDLWDGCLGRADYKTAFQLPPDECNELRLDPASKR